MVATAIVGILFAADARKAVDSVVLPLNHEQVIREQAQRRDLDPALIAGVIYAESHFREGLTSSAGAQGLMQITPGTAADIARKSGGIAFETADLHTPDVNIRYGAFYLRYLLDRYDGNTALAVAAYNAGYGNVDKWVLDAGSRGDDLAVDDIPFPETRLYVRKVLDARRDYRAKYAKELGT